MPAVSVRSRREPSETGKKPESRHADSSSIEKPLSGPTMSNIFLIDDVLFKYDSTDFADEWNTATNDKSNWLRKPRISLNVKSSPIEGISDLLDCLAAALAIRLKREIRLADEDSSFILEYPFSEK